MKDHQFQASLKSAKFNARKDPNHPDKTIRRVQFSLCRSFGTEEAEWLGKIGIDLLEKLKGRDMKGGQIYINGYHGKAEFSGIFGTATANIDGLVAKAAVAGKENQEYEEITFGFEAPCEAKFLAFIGASLNEYIECDIRRVQQELDFVPVVDAVKKMADAIPKGSSMTISFEGKSATLEGTGPVRE